MPRERKRRPFFSLWREVILVKNKPAEFVPRLERNQQRPLTNENANPRNSPVPYSSIMGTSGRFDSPHQHQRTVSEAVSDTVSDTVKVVKQYLKPNIVEIEAEPSPTPTPWLQLAESPPNEEATTWLRDPLPETVNELKTRLQYHVDKLEMAAMNVGIVNSWIKDHHEDASKTRWDNNMTVAFDKQVTIVAEIRRCRSAYGTFVEYHRREARRAARKILLEQVFRYPLPESYKNLPTDAEWGDLFST